MRVADSTTPEPPQWVLTKADHASAASARRWPSLERSEDVVFASDVLSPENPVLARRINGRDALVVVTPSVERLYGAAIHRYFAHHELSRSTGFMVLHRREATKSMDAALEVCRQASRAGLGRSAPVVAIGGGVCTDICGLAASLFRRGIPHINVPTTLVGLIDAGIGLKNAVNDGGRKSALGSFHPPELALLDAAFLRSLPRHAIGHGLAEMLKLAIVSDADLYELLRAYGSTVLETRMHTPEVHVRSMLERSVHGMLDQLAANPYETEDYRRPVDFGHTFSPYFEAESGHTVPHGAAVAMDMALSTQLAVDLGLLCRDVADGIVTLIRELGLPVVWHGTSIDGLWNALRSAIAHRNGDLHLVVPIGIGSCTYLPIDDLDVPVVVDALERLARAHARQRDRAVSP